MKRLPGWLRVILTIGCWVTVRDYSKAWDTELNDLMKTNRFMEIDAYTATLGGHLIWLENHPYASFHKYSHDFTARLQPIPKRITMLRAMDNVKEDFAWHESHNVKLRSVK